MTTQINLDIVWAETGGISDPGDPKWAQGWQAEIPTFQHFNFLLNSLDRNSLSLMESGNWQWQEGIGFEVGASVRESGVQYHCTSAHTSSVANQPSTDALENFWVKAPLYGTGTPLKALGVAVREANVRASGTTWTGNDLTLENSSALLSLATTGGSKNWLMGNIGGELAVVDVDTTFAPDGRSIALSEPTVHRLYHEGHKPTVAEVAGAVEEAPQDGVLYSRLDGAWSKVTSTVVQAEPPPPSIGDGQGWFNLEDGKLYIDIDDGDSSQWTPANPPQVPVSNAIDVAFNNVGTPLVASTVQDALVELSLLP